MMAKDDMTFGEYCERAYARQLEQEAVLRQEQDARLTVRTKRLFDEAFPEFAGRPKQINGNRVTIDGIRLASVREDGYEDAWAVMVQCPGCGEEVTNARWAYDAADIARILREPEPSTARHDCPAERPAEVKQTPQGLLEASLAAQDSTERTALSLQSIAASLVLMVEEWDPSDMSGTYPT